MDRPVRTAEHPRPCGFKRLLEAVKAAVPIEDVARRHTTLEPFGGKAWFIGRYPHPDHEDCTASFYIYPPGRYWCYGCSRGGDVLDLYADPHNLDDKKHTLIDLAGASEGPQEGDTAPLPSPGPRAAA